MAKKETTRTSIDELNESLSSFEQKVENNKKYIYWIAGGIVVLALIILGYVYGIHPAIIVGRLQHKKLIPFTTNADVFEKIDLFG